VPYRMIRFFWPVGLPLLLLLAVSATALFIVASVPEQAVAGSQPVGAETWQLGITSEGDAAYSAVIGRWVDTSAAFRSNRGVQDIFFIFPAPASTRTIESMRLQIVSRSGTYPSTTSLALEVRNSNGSLQRTVSATSLDLQTAATATWIDIALATNPANLAIAPGEHLVVHFALADVPSGTLDVRPVFEVVIQ
jgi:hypothetical protein